MLRTESSVCVLAKLLYISEAVKTGKWLEIFFFEFWKAFKFCEYFWLYFRVSYKLLLTIICFYMNKKKKSQYITKVLSPYAYNIHKLVVFMLSRIFHDIIFILNYGEIIWSITKIDSMLLANIKCWNLYLNKFKKNVAQFRF